MGWGCHIAEGVVLGHPAGDQSGEVFGLVHPAEIRSYVRGRFEPRAVHEDRFRVLLGDIDGGVHVPEAGGEDEVVSPAGVLGDDPLGLGPFRDIFGDGGRDVGKRLFHLLPPLVMGVVPSGVSDGTDQDERRLDLLLGLDGP
jgi:hypothetical protein